MDRLPGLVLAPFAPEQLSSLNAFQITAPHPWMCGNSPLHHMLVASIDGWICVDCDYSQDWAFDWMADWTWRALRHQQEAQT